MSMSHAVQRPPDDIFYPESDGEPMAENLLQQQTIRLLRDGLEEMFFDDPTVMVIGDVFWYPEEGEPKSVVAPDVMLITGIADRDFRIFKQWISGGHVPFVIEVLSPSNTMREMNAKLRFYEQHGVDEYWLFDPESGRFEVWVRDDKRLIGIADPASGWTSPVTGVKVHVHDTKIVVIRPDGERFPAPDERIIAMRAAEQLAEEMRAEFQAATARLEVASVRADEANARADEANTRADEANTRADEANVRADEAVARAEAVEREVAELRAAVARLTGSD